MICILLPKYSHYRLQRSLYNKEYFTSEDYFLAQCRQELLNTCFTNENVTFLGSKQQKLSGPFAAIFQAANVHPLTCQSLTHRLRPLESAAVEK